MAILYALEIKRKKSKTKKKEIIIIVFQKGYGVFHEI